MGQKHLKEIDAAQAAEIFQHLAGVAEGYPRGNHAGPPPGAVAGQPTGRPIRIGGDGIKFFVEDAVQLGEEGWGCDPATRVLAEIGLPVEPDGLPAGHILPGVADARRGTDDDGDRIFFRQGERRSDHLLRLAGTRRIDDGRLGEVGEETAVLLGLGTVGTGVVGGDNEKSPHDAEIGGAREGIGRHIEADLLHGDGGPLSRIARRQGRLERRLLVHGPLDVHGGRRLTGKPENGGQDFRGGRARVGGEDAAAALHEPPADGLVSHQYALFHVHSSKSKSVKKVLPIGALRTKKAMDLCPWLLFLVSILTRRRRTGPLSLWILPPPPERIAAAHSLHLCLNCFAPMTYPGEKIKPLFRLRRPPERSVRLRPYVR